MLKTVKVPVVMQMENLECDATCLAMILADHGKDFIECPICLP